LKSKKETTENINQKYINSSCY